MTFNINQFKGQLEYGGAKASLFEASVTIPGGAAIEKFRFMCQAAQLPESTLGTIEVPYFGRKVKIAGDRTFAEWTVTVINDEDFAVRNAMEAWMSSVNSHEGNLNNTGSAAPNAYKGQGQVTQFGKNGNRLKTYDFVGMFPTNVAAITLDWDTTDDIERFDVTFQFDYWTVGGGDFSGPSMG